MKKEFEAIKANPKFSTYEDRENLVYILTKAGSPIAEEYTFNWEEVANWMNKISDNTLPQHEVYLVYATVRKTYKHASRFIPFTHSKLVESKVIEVEKAKVVTVGAVGRKPSYYACEGVNIGCIKMPYEHQIPVVDLGEIPDRKIALDWESVLVSVNSSPVDCEDFEYNVFHHCSNKSCGRRALARAINRELVLTTGCELMLVKNQRSHKDTMHSVYKRIQERATIASAANF